MSSGVLPPATAPAPSHAVPEWPAQIVIAAAAAVVTFLVLLIRPSENSDFEGLFNPIYMFLNTGRMTYPVHHAFEEMVIHPPVRYLEVALLMKAGVPGPWAAALVPWLLGLCALGFMAFSDLTPRLKTALAAGLAGTLIVFSSPAAGGLRPDLQLFLAWVAGLVALETGRAGGWVIWRLVAGGALVTYASSLHYFGAAALLAVVPYAAAVVWNRGRAGALPPCLALMAGGCLVGVPYLAFFVVPHWAGIMAIVNAVQGTEGSGAAFRKHLADYAVLPANNSGWITVLLVALYRVRVPLFLWAMPGLARAETRVLLAAALPLCTFVLLYAQGKSTFYYMPEAFIALSSLAYVAVALVEWLAARWRGGTAVRAAAAAVLGVALLAPARELYDRLLTPISTLPVFEIDALRAAARSIVGRRAAIGGRIGAWYSSGAHEWHDIARDLLWRESIVDIDPASYFRSFDYLVEHESNSYVTVNHERKTLGTWYADGTLQLHGFLYAHRRGLEDFDPAARHAVIKSRTARHDALLFSARTPAVVRGFYLSGRTLWRFSSAPRGTHVFVSLLCPVTSPSRLNAWDLPNFNHMFLPPTGPPRSGRALFDLHVSPEQPQPSIVTSFMPEDRWREMEPGLRAECRVRDVHVGTLERLDAMTLYRQERAHDRPMVFTREAWRRRAAQPEGPLRRVAGVVLANNQSTIRTPPTQWAYGAELPLVWNDAPRGEGYLKARFRVREGVIGLGVVNRERNDFISRLDFPAAAQEYCVFVRLPRVQKAGAVVVQTWEKAEAALVDVTELSLVMPAHTGDPLTATCAVSVP